MNYAVEKNKITKINMSAFVFSTPAAQSPHQQHPETGGLCRSCNKRVNQSYKKSLFKMQERKNSRHPIEKDQLFCDNTDKLHVKRKESLNSDLQIIKRRSLQMNPGIFMVKQKNKGKVQGLKIDLVSHHTSNDSQPSKYLAKSLSQRSQKKPKSLLHFLTPSSKNMKADVPIKQANPSKQGESTLNILNNLNPPIQNILQNSAINPYTNGLYLHNRNQKIDEMKKMKNKRKMHHQNSIVESYKVATIKLGNPLEKYSRKFTHQCLVPEHDINSAQEDYIKDNFNYDSRQAYVGKVNKHKRASTANYHWYLNSHRAKASKVYRGHLDVWTEGQPAPWPAQLNINQSIDIMQRGL